MKTNRFSIHITVFLCLGLLITVNANASMESAWDALITNQIDSAKAEFANQLQTNPSEEALQGLYLSNWARGQAPEMAQILTRLLNDYPQSQFLPAYLSMWGNSEFHGWKARDRAALLQKSVGISRSSIHRQIIAHEWMETLDMLLDEDVQKAAQEAGVLLNHWAVVGPFGRYGAPDLFNSFGPEKGFQDEYQGWRSKVAVQNIDTPDLAGLVEFSSLMHPSTGIAYAFNAFESDKASEAWLTVQSPVDLQVWLNGEPVMEKTHRLLDTAKSHTASISIPKGKNLLVVKSHKTNGSWWIRASLMSHNEEQLQISSVPFNTSDFESLFLKPFEAKSARSLECSVISSPYPLALPDSEAAPQKMAQSIFLAAWHLDRAEYTAALLSLEQSQKIAPDFALLHLLNGDVSLQLARSRPGSKLRFYQEAETSFSKALDNDPYCTSAMTELVAYYLDRAQVDQALDNFKDHLAKYPDIREKGNSGLIDYSLGILYDQKRFKEDSIRLFNKSLNDWVVSYETYSYLFDYYQGHNELDRATDIITKALDQFPAYVPFLERASRSDSKSAALNKALDYVRKAIRIHPRREQYSFLLGTILEHQGEINQAREWYSGMLDAFPDNPRLYERIAALDMLDSNRTSSLALYEKAYKIAPRRMRPFRALRDAGGVDGFPYQKYDMQLDEIDISKADRWKTSRASVIYLLDLMVVDIHDDGTYDQYIHQAIKIQNQEGMKKWAETVIPKGGNVEIIMARTITPDGTEWDVSHVQDLSGEQSLSMYGIEPGVILEYAYINRTGRSDPGLNYCGGGYFFGSDDDPMLLSQLTMVKPAHLPLHFDVNPDDFKGEIKHEDGKVVYVWSKEMSEGLKPERFAPSLSQRVPSIQWSTCPDWLTFAELQRISIMGSEETSIEIAELAKKLKTESSSKMDYITSVFNYVRDNIEETSGGSTTADTIVLGAGGRYQKLRLVRQLLHCGGIKTRISLTLDNEQSSGYRPMPVLSYPGSIVLVIPRQEEVAQRMLLDFTSRFAVAGSIDPRINKQISLVLDETAPFFEPVNPLLWETGIIDRHFSLTLREDHSALISGHYFYENMFDRQIREALTNPEVKKRLADSQLARDLRGIKVEASDIVQVNDLSLPPRLEFNGVLPDIAKPSGEHTIKVSPVLARSNASSIVSEPTRQFRMEFLSSVINDPLDIRIDFSYYLDQGATIALPENTLFISEFGFYSLFYKWDGNDVVIKRSFLIPEQNIEPEVYHRFVDFCRSIDQAENREIVVSVPISS